MPTSLQDLVHDIRVSSTMLLFGAGSSIPSHAPSVKELIDHLSAKFRQSSDGFNLAEFTQLIEKKTNDRRRLITEVRHLFKGLKPTSGLLNLPLYDWKSIYTTNYDNLIELSYQKKRKSLPVITCDFDFSVSSRSVDTRLFKMHGTIEKDVSFGDTSRLILTEGDYDLIYDYREHIYNTLKADLAESDLIIIGHSLADNDIKSIVTQAIKLNQQAYFSGRITLLMYQRDEDRALLYEGRGLKVVFAGIDEFFAELAKSSPGPLFDYKPSDNPIEKQISLVPTVVDVAHEIETGKSDVSRMFNGWPASYADISNGLTFSRSASDKIYDYVVSGDGIAAALLGASGVGKTTAIRQLLIRLNGSGYLCWEHKGDAYFEASEWNDFADYLAEINRHGVIFVDEAHHHLREINDLVDSLAGRQSKHLFVLVSSARNNWQPRVKTPQFFKNGRQFFLSKLDSPEIDRLLVLVEQKDELLHLVEESFAGFTRTEKRRRLAERSEADMFVCMKNIFAHDSYDDIILREYASLPETLQEVYRLVSALETLGVRVHRQLVIRLLGIPMASTLAFLDGLTDIINEYTISDKHHIYGWRGRHTVISGIITKYKFNNKTELVSLIDKVIDNTLPSYEIERKSAIDLCNIDTGIPKVADKKTQNRLLRKMISTLPGERVPRHRLIRNLTESGMFDQAATEIRIFEKDFKVDAPVSRLKIALLVARAVDTPGILLPDRLTILDQAKNLALTSIKKHSYAKGIFAAYCEVGINILRLSGSYDVFNDALKQLKAAELRLGDPDIANIVRRYERLEASYSISEPHEDGTPLVLDLE